jgi:hypothetical protein
VVVEDNKQCCLLLMDISSHFQVWDQILSMNFNA